MEEKPFLRTELLVGKSGIDKLRDSKVMVFGVGGVGSYAVEALARAGVGNITIVDNDIISMSNLNRQVHATLDTVGKVKVEIERDRILSINDKCNVICHKVFVLENNLADIIDEDVDYIIDAIDTISTKIALAKYCEDNNIKLISSMGTGNKLDPTKFVITDIYKTRVCPLAKVMRHELKKRGVKKLKVLYSEEVPIKPMSSDVGTENVENGKRKKQTPGSISFVPPVAGMIIGGEVIKSIISN